jgi:hypothetical protein
MFFYTSHFKTRGTFQEVIKEGLGLLSRIIFQTTIYSRHFFFIIKREATKLQWAGFCVLMNLKFWVRAAHGHNARSNPFNYGRNISSNS